MGIFDRLLAAISTPPSDHRTTGRPTSSNGASSMHARWVGVPTGATSVSVDLTVNTPPVTDDLFFWALQASFVSGTTVHGAGHLGLQHISGYPVSAAVNWGGYRTGGGELEGSTSTLPSARNNVNTRNFEWRSGQPYRLTIERSGPDRWSGIVTAVESGQATLVRELHSPGDSLQHIVMWSEVFARCDAPSVEVSWGNPTFTTVDSGAPSSPAAIDISYQRVDDGGCSNTETSIDPMRPITSGNARASSAATITEIDCCSTEPLRHRRRTAEGVDMFERVIGQGWGSVAIETAPIGHALGDDVSGTVTLRAKREIGPGHLAVSIVCVQKDVRTIPPIVSKRITRESHSHEVWRRTLELDSGLALAAGESTSMPFSVELPPRQEGNEDHGIPEWARGTIAVFNTVTFARSQLQWQIRAKFHHPDGFDLRHHVSLLVNP